MNDQNNPFCYMSDEHHPQLEPQFYSEMEEDLISSQTSMAIDETIISIMDVETQKALTSLENEWQDFMEWKHCDVKKATVEEVLNFAREAQKFRDAVERQLEMQLRPQIERAVYGN